MSRSHMFVQLQKVNRKINTCGYIGALVIALMGPEAAGTVMVFHGAMPYGPSIVAVPEVQLHSEPAGLDRQPTELISIATNKPGALFTLSSITAYTANTTFGAGTS
ncbi:hypothetical protein B0H13DRAFT_1903390 [Mycena leptocephala]|nr:hypothetical protein B0H13DRAFT_1903390 [Mycena leptocephala]